jgi:uncharacterized protein
MRKISEAGLVSAPSVLFPLSLSHRALLNSHLCSVQSWLSSYSLANLFIWRDLYSYYWTLVDDHLCVFARQGENYYMPLPPMGNGFSEQAVRRSFSLMKQINSDPAVTRIENVDEKATDFFKEMGLGVRLTACEYLYQREALANLQGDRYKSKRWAVNHFLKHNQAVFEPYQPADLSECLSLFNDWRSMRQEKFGDSYYLALLEDAALAHRRVMEYFDELGLVGRVVRINGRIKGYTFGFEIRPQVFCVLLEVSDLRIKGLSQFLFWKLCQELKGYQYINALDDSGLENLKKVKESYHPERLVPSFTVYHDS